MSKPIFAVHRRNRIDQLGSLPKGCWVEIDLDLYEGEIYLNHDPMTVAPEKMSPAPDRFADYLPMAIKAGVAGFVLDCKRENVEKYADILLAQHGIKKENYCYLNEMEIQADIFMEKNAGHSNCIRLWKYRGAEDILRYVHDMQAIGQPVPTWIWVDTWQHGLLASTDNYHLPLNGRHAQAFQQAGVKLCVCSPELYVHVYGKEYSPDDINIMEAGIKKFRQSLESEGIHPNMVCTKQIFGPCWNLV